MQDFDTGNTLQIERVPDFWVKWIFVPQWWLSLKPPPAGMAKLTSASSFRALSISCKHEPLTSWGLKLSCSSHMQACCNKQSQGMQRVWRIQRANAEDSAWKMPLSLRHIALQVWGTCSSKPRIARAPVTSPLVKTRQIVAWPGHPRHAHSQSRYGLYQLDLPWAI